MMDKKVFLSASVDDGHPLDLKIADIFLKKNIKAIFYISIKNEQRKILNRKEIRQLSKHFEIGNHTYHHVDLTKLSAEEAKEEILSGKKALEDIIGKEVTSFCPPKGKYNDKILKLIKSLGHTDCRSGRIINFYPPDKKNFLWHPNLHIFPYSRTKDLLHCGKNYDLYSLSQRLLHFDKKHLELIDVFQQRNKPFHVWMHSWEIEQYDLWKTLESL